jgi:hypothetical protein
MTEPGVHIKVKVFALFPLKQLAYGFFSLDDYFWKPHFGATGYFLQDWGLN